MIRIKNKGVADVVEFASKAMTSEYEAIKNSLDYYDFFKEAFNILEPGTPYVDNWHVKYLCDIFQEEVERVARKEKKTGDLIINIMPRSLKSYISTIMLNAWAWTRYPWMRFVALSYAEPLAVEHSEKTLRLIKSDWYQQNFGGAFSILGSAKGKKYFANDKGGERRATSVGGTLTGFGGNFLIIDDPIKPPKQGEISFNETELRQTNAWYDSTAYNRINNADVDLRCIIMQRLHHNDLTQHCLNKKSSKYRHICIPGIYTEDLKPKYLKQYYQEDKFSGELLFFPKKFSSEILEAYEENMGDNYSGQVLQRPDRKGAGDWKEDYFKKITRSELPVVADVQLTAWDLALTEKARKDRSASAFVRGFRYKGAAYITDYGWDFKKFTELLPWILKNGTNHSIEKKSAGEAIIATMKERGIRVTPYTKDNRDKFQESALATEKAKKNDVYILDSIWDSLLNSREQGVCKFPTATWDDVHDAFCNFIINIFDGVMSREDISEIIKINKYTDTTPSFSAGSTRGINIRDLGI